MDTPSMLTPTRGHVIVLPSRLRSSGIVPAAYTSGFEEILSFFLLSLRHPEVQVTYLLSEPLDPVLLRYYLSLLPDAGTATDRLHLLLPEPIAGETLTVRVLRDEALLARLDALIAAGPADCSIVPFAVGAGEEELAQRLSVRLIGPPTGTAPLGSKSAGRRLAMSLGIPVVAGVEGLRSAVEIDEALGLLASRCPGRADYLLKLNDHYGGYGNVLLRTDPAAPPTLRTARIRFPMPGQTVESVLADVAEQGAVVETLLPADGLRSVSAAVEVRRDAAVAVLATHEQRMAGNNGQLFTGCSYPADPTYRDQLETYAHTVGEALAAHGVRGLVGVDFLVSERNGERAVYFGEINLRLTGTTHPLGMAHHLLSGSAGIPAGHAYVASDLLHSSLIIGRDPQQIIDRLVASGLAYSHATKQGAVLHCVGSPPAGPIGVTCIGPDTAHAEKILADVLRLFEVTP